MSEGIKTIIKKPIPIRELVNQVSPFLKISAQARAVQGEHVLVVFETPVEMIEQALEFLRIGIMNNEDVMIVTNAMPIDSLREKIAKGWNNDVNLENMEQEGRITLQSFQEWYMPNGKFDLQNAITNLTKKIQHTNEHGRKGLRTFGDMNLFFDMGMTEEAIKYEKTFDQKSNFLLIGFCAYTGDRFHRLDRATARLLYQRHNRIIE